MTKKPLFISILNIFFLFHFLNQGSDKKFYLCLKFKYSKFCWDGLNSRSISLENVYPTLGKLKNQWRKSLYLRDILLDDRFF